MHTHTVFGVVKARLCRFPSMSRMSMWVCRAAPVSAAGGCRGGQAAGAGGGAGVPVHLPHYGGLPVVPHPLCQQPGAAGRCRPGAPSHGCSRCSLLSCTYTCIFLGPARSPSAWALLADYQLVCMPMNVVVPFCQEANILYYPVIV